MMPPSAWSPSSRPARARLSAWHAAPFLLLEEMGHVMMLDAGREGLADRVTGWLEETFR